MLDSVRSLPLVAKLSFLRVIALVFVSCLTNIYTYTHTLVCLTLAYKLTSVA